MKYYYHPLSPNCRKTTALLDHLGVDAERILVDLPKGEQLSRDFLAVNPNGKVPALVDGRRRLWESNAILIHLAESAGSDLWPDHFDGRIDVLRWMFWEQGQLMYVTGVVFFERLIKPMLEQEADEERTRQAIGGFRRLAGVLQAHFERSPYLLGSRLTIADWAVAANLSFADEIGLPLDDFPEVRRWLGTLDQTPAWKASAPALPG